MFPIARRRAQLPVAATLIVNCGSAWLKAHFRVRARWHNLKNMSIKALIFDVGGVLVRTESLAGREKWARRFGLGPWELHDIVFGSPAAAAATLGQASDAEVWAVARAQLNLTLEQLAEFRADFWAGDRFDDPLLDWIAGKRGPYRTGILSNAWPAARQFLTSHPKIVAAFEAIVISAEEGLRKPQPEIYERALKRLNVSASEAVFVDDVLENVEAARAIGLAAIHFKAGLDIPVEMAKLGVG